MFTPGLVSVTFRPLARWEIASLMRECALTAVEWGGDVHVPADDPTAIADAVQVSRDNGITIVSYGSYYRAGATTDETTAEFQKQLSATVALGAPNIRIWAGTKGSQTATAAERKAFTDDIRHVCRLAAAKQKTVSLECHNGTLTDDCDSALRLVEEVAADNLRLYWQPNQFRDDAYNLDTVRRLLPYTSNVHVFSWTSHDGRTTEMYPLDRFASLWRKYIDVLRSDNVDRNLLIEFVCDNTTDQLRRDAETLLGWL